MELRLGWGSPLYFLGPLESHRPLNKDWDLPGRRRRGGRDVEEFLSHLGSLFQILTKRRCCTPAFLRRAPIGCGQGCSPHGPGLFLGSWITGESLTHLLSGLASL